MIGLLLVLVSIAAIIGFVLGVVGAAVLFELIERGLE